MPLARWGAPEKNRRVDFARPSTNLLVCDAARMVPVAKKSRGAGTAKPLDTSDWTQADADLALTWTVDLSKANPPVRNDLEQDRTKSDVPLDLTMSLAGKTHSLALHTNAGVTGTPTCSSIHFFWAGWLLRFKLQRLADKRVLLTRIAGGEATADVNTPLFVFAVPSGAKVHQSLVTIAPNGTRSQDECIGPAGP